MEKGEGSKYMSLVGQKLKYTFLSKESYKNEIKNVGITMSSVKKQAMWLTITPFKYLFAGKKTTTETFAQTVRSKQLTNDDLVKNHKAYTNKALIFLVGAFVCIGSFAYAIGSGKGIFAIATPALFAFNFGLLSLIQVHKAYQVKQRTYCSFKEFFQAGNLSKLDKWI